MGKINKKIILICILLVLILSGGTYFVVSYVKSLNSKLLITQQHNAELDFAKNTLGEIKQKPFIAKLPIFTNQYSIYYSSVNDEIDVVFIKSNQDINILKGIYQNQILNTLIGIGVNMQAEKIVWLKQQ